MCQDQLFSYGLLLPRIVHHAEAVAVGIGEHHVVGAAHQKAMARGTSRTPQTIEPIRSMAMSSLVLVPNPRAPAIVRDRRLMPCRSRLVRALRSYPCSEAHRN
jgi:hypothetical protein